MSLGKTVMGFGLMFVGATIAFAIAYWQTKNLAAASVFGTAAAGVVFQILSHKGQFR